MNRIINLAFALFLPAIAEAETFLVDNGESRAEIIIAEDPPRTVHLAARELQTYVGKITGAKLEIASEPSGQAIKIYVGESEHTKKLGIDTMMWGFRLGTRQPFGRQAAHGMKHMTDNERTFRNHPDWFALYGGKRQNDPQIKNNQLCYSNEELLQATVRFCQVQLDHYDMDVVSIQPPDGYTAMCQCELCEGKDSPELGYRGRLSNYVWDFVNRVAKEVGKTHPDKKISNLAYGIYTEPHRQAGAERSGHHRRRAASVERGSRGSPAAAGGLGGKDRHAG